MVWKDSEQFGLDWERFVEEPLVEGLFYVVDEENSHSLVVVLRTSSTSNHLQDVCDWHINIALLLAVKNLGAFHHHQMRWEIHSPGQSRGRHQNLKKHTTFN